MEDCIHSKHCNDNDDDDDDNDDGGGGGQQKRTSDLTISTRKLCVAYNT